MKVFKSRAARKAVRSARPTSDVECTVTPAVRFIQRRFDVSVSVARTIAALAQMGDQP